VDTRIFDVKDVSFILGRCSATEGGMAMLPIVPEMDDLEQRPARLRAGAGSR
jgi:hypothetical protein